MTKKKVLCIVKLNLKKSFITFKNFLFQEFFQKNVRLIQETKEAHLNNNLEQSVYILYNIILKG